MTAPVHVALVGFGNFEQSRLEAFVRLAARRVPSYRVTASPHSADIVLSNLDADAAVLDSIAWHPRQIGVGGSAHAGLVAHMARPLNMNGLLRLFDTIAIGGPAEAAAPQALLDIDLTTSDSASPAPARPALEGTRATIQMRHVLIVDSHEDTLRFLSHCLSRFGFAVHLATTGDEAVWRVPRQRFDYVFLDAGLRVVDAPTICRLVKKRAEAANETPPVVVLLNSPEGPIHRLRGRWEGFDACLTNPVTHDAVVDIVRHHIVSSAVMADTAMVPLVSP